MIKLLTMLCIPFMVYAMEPIPLCPSRSTVRFQQAAYAVIETLRVQDAELCERISTTLDDSAMVRHHHTRTASPNQESPQSPHVTLDIIRQLKDMTSDRAEKPSSERELALLIKNLIKEQELTIQDNELALARHEQGALKWKVKCGATFAGALITSISTAASIVIVALINRQC